jgi:hypothetical protein
MADLRIPYETQNNYLGMLIAQVAPTIYEAIQKTNQVLGILTCIGTDADVETALGMAHGFDYGYHLRGLLVTQKASLESLASDVVKIDKGL